MNRGGLETMLMNYYRHIDRNKIQFDFMVHREEEGHYDKEILALGGRIYRMPQIRPGNYKKYFKLLDEFFMQHNEYKIVHSHINENSSFVLRAAKKAGVPGRIAHSHTSNLGIDYKLLFRLYARLIMKGTPNRYFACSDNAGKWLFGSKINQKVNIIKNAIDLEKFEFDEKNRDMTREQLDVKNNIVVGHVGRFNKSKNHEFLIDVFKELHIKRPDAILLLIGGGETLPTIKKKVQRLGLSEAVKFLGLRKDIPNLLKAMDIFIFPSYFEGAPVALIEAQASGLNCFVSDTISRDNDLTGLVKFLSLDEPPIKWAMNMLDVTSIRKNTSGALARKGYDIRAEALRLSKYYLKL